MKLRLLKGAEDGRDEIDSVDYDEGEEEGRAWRKPFERTRATTKVGWRGHSPTNIDASVRSLLSLTS